MPSYPICVLTGIIDYSTLMRYLWPFSLFFSGDSSPPTGNCCDHPNLVFPFKIERKLGGKNCCGWSCSFFKPIFSKWKLWMYLPDGQISPLIQANTISEDEVTFYCTYVSDQFWHEGFLSLQQRPNCDGTPKYLDSWHVMRETARYVVAIIYLRKFFLIETLAS